MSYSNNVIIEQPKTKRDKKGRFVSRKIKNKNGWWKNEKIMLKKIENKTCNGDCYNCT